MFPVKHKFYKKSNGRIVIFSPKYVFYEVFDYKRHRENTIKIK